MRQKEKSGKHLYSLVHLKIIKYMNEEKSKEEKTKWCYMCNKHIPQPIEYIIHIG